MAKLRHQLMLHTITVDRLNTENKSLYGQLESYKKLYKNLHDCYNKLVKKHKGLKDYNTSVSATFKKEIKKDVEELMTKILNLQNY